MASQMLASVKGMSACTTPNEASASTTEASCGVSQQTRTCARTPIGRYLRVGVRHRLNRTTDLDGEVDADLGSLIEGFAHGRGRGACTYPAEPLATGWRWC